MERKDPQKKPRKRVFKKGSRVLVNLQDAIYDDTQEKATLMIMRME